MKALRYGAWAVSCAVAAVALAACPSPELADRGTVTVPEKRERTALEPAPGGRIHQVELVSDGEGNRFEPAQIHVRAGDVIRWRLRSGVHNAHFVVDSNPGVRERPPRTPMLQLPGEWIDTAVLLPTGEYYFHCDPHAMLGMVGTLIVTDGPPAAP